MQVRIMTNGCYDLAATIEEAQTKIENIAGEPVTLSGVWKPSERYPGEERMNAFFASGMSAGIYREVA